MNDFEKEFEFVRKIYRDILNGYTVLYLNEKILYFKHLTDLEYSECNDFFIKQYKKAKDSGLLDEKEKIKVLKDSGHWDEAKEERIKKLESEIELLTSTKKKLIIKSQINSIEEKLLKYSSELNNLKKERLLLLDLTAEEFAKKKANEYILYISIYKNSKLTEEHFESLQQFEDLDLEDLLKFFMLYNKLLEELDIRNIKKIAVLPFFLNNFFLSKNNPYYFYGKPIVALTKHQLELFVLGKQYENALIQSKGNPPTSYQTLEDLVNWYENQSSINSNINKNQNDKTANTYVGATKEEIKNIIGNDKETVDLLEEAKKIGKDLDFEDLLKIHGEK